MSKKITLFLRSWLRSMSLERVSQTKTRRSRYDTIEIINIRDYLKESKKRFFDEYNNISAPTADAHKYTLLYTLRKGKFGSVKLVQDKTTKNFLAMKVYEKRLLVESGLVRHILNEKKLLQTIDFPLAVRMEFFCMDYSWIYFIMPFLSGGDLHNLLKVRGRFSERLSCFYAAQIVLALEYLQCILFVHRDLKPGNILLDCHGYIKIADYGFAKMVESRTYTLCGTCPYIAPEIIEGNGYARSVDWWSLGVLLYEMVAGKPPFQAKHKNDLFTKILYYKFDFPDHFSKSLQNILKKLLERDVTRRIGNMKRGADDVKKHDWFKGVSWLMLINKEVAPLLNPYKADYNLIANFPRARQTSLMNISKTNQFAEKFKDF